MEKTIHMGRNIKRFREMLGVKQEGLALELGDEWNQRKISLLEQKEVVEAELLEQVAKVLNLPIEAIQNFDEGHALQIISNTFTDFKDNASASASNHNCNLNFNPVDKIIELYEALVESEREKVELMQMVVDKMK